MDIQFADGRLAAQCNEDHLAMPAWGKPNAKALRKRLDDLHAAPTLEVMRSLPGRCHQLTGDRKGTLAVHLTGATRMVFEPANDPVPRKPDGGLDWQRVTAVRILEVVDYHE